jgi:LysM repeat protein
MATTVRPGDTLIRIARRSGVSLAALERANPGVDPRRLHIGQKLNIPGQRDEFVSAPGPHDASAQAALRTLAQQGGSSFDAGELARTIDVGTADADGQAAGREYADFAQWAQTNASHLTAGAKQVMSIYARVARQAQAAHQSGLTAAQRTNMFAEMKQVSEPVAPPPPPTPQPGTPRNAKEWQARALADPNHLFKRQVRDSNWNSESDAPRRSGNCGIASLAMAVEAYGLEKGGLDAPRHAKDQDTIDLVARAMPHKTDLVNGRHTHNWLTNGPLAKNGTGTYPSQVAAAATKLGLTPKYVRNATLSDLDAALAKGHMMELGGKPGTKWANAMGYHFHGGHSVLVMGKTPDGRYLVMDPLTTKGPMKLTADQVKSFATSGYTSVELWRA